ncbi:MAG TPA: hypothetical protein VFO91_11885, partial [Anaerolineales bacterium]|nr:hypothetical protein [Anaerolineales bacterium]
DASNEKYFYAESHLSLREFPSRHPHEMAIQKIAKFRPIIFPESGAGNCQAGQWFIVRVRKIIPAKQSFVSCVGQCQVNYSV